MGGDVDVFGVELAERVDGLVESFNARPLEGWKNLERESCLLVFLDQIDNFHASVFVVCLSLTGKDNETHGV